MFSCFGTILACDGRTDGWTNRQTHDNSIYHASIAIRGNKNVYLLVDSRQYFNAAPVICQLKGVDVDHTQVVNDPRQT